MNVTLIDSPFCNLANIANALRRVGSTPIVSADPEAIASSACIVLPGVGSFSAAMQWLIGSQISEALRTAVSRGSALLGICVGHQLLFETSEEEGRTSGLGFLSGAVTRFDAEIAAVPQIGWNQLRIERRTSLLCEVANGAEMYFANSFRVEQSVDAIATATHGTDFVAAAARGRVCGVQFHPEKSHRDGDRILRNFVELAGKEEAA
jgi:imidazole glycerol phosphate synthase glutamine amidotransferase subunit